jgi:osmotically-inducible protein OsmY
MTSKLLWKEGYHQVKLFSGVNLLTAEPIQHFRSKTQEKQMIDTLAKTDSELQEDVRSELSYEPSVNVTDLGVLVKDGTVTIDGVTTSYIEKWAAVNAVKRIHGVWAIIDEIEVNIPETDRRTDEDIAAAVADRIAWSTNIPLGTIEVIVNEGWVSLIGEVEWLYQQNAAVNLVQQMLGVTGVSERISVKPKPMKMVIEQDINLALNGKSSYFQARFQR